MTNVTPADGLDVGDGLKLAWAPKDEAGAAITGAASQIVLTIREKGQAVVTKTSVELTESPLGTYYYVHKVAVAGTGRGNWTYNGSGNSDGVEQFYFKVNPVDS